MRIDRLLFSLLFFSSVSAETPVVSEVEAEPPGVLEYMGRKVAQTMHWQGAEWLTRNHREREEAVSVMHEQLQLKPGQVVCDLGAGNGYNTVTMARAVAPGGKVYAVDIQPEMLDLLRARAKKEGIANIEYVEGKLFDPCLPENEMDVILAVDAYHEFSHPEEMLAGIKKALKPTGRLVLLEYRGEDDSVPILEEHKMKREQILKELDANGFQEVRRFDELPWQHMIFFEKKP